MRRTCGICGGVLDDRDALDVCASCDAKVKSGEMPGKASAGKARWDLLPWDALKLVVDVLTFGSKKYAPNNWRWVENWRVEYDGALERHLVAWRLGEWADPQSGLPHLAHACCDALFLLALSAAEGVGIPGEKQAPEKS